MAVLPHGKVGAYFTFRVENRSIPEFVVSGLKKTIAACNGQVVTLTIAEAKKKRSQRQNAFYFGVVLPAVLEMFREAGSDATRDEIHVFLKAEVGGLKREVIVPGGKAVELAASSVELSTQQWEDWLEKIRAWAANWNVAIPFPNESMA